MRAADIALSDEALSDILRKDSENFSDAPPEKEISTEDDYVPSESTITGRPH